MNSVKMVLLHIMYGRYSEVVCFYLNWMYYFTVC